MTSTYVVLYNDETIEKQLTGFEITFMFCDKFNVKYEYEDTGLGLDLFFIEIMSL